MKKILLMFLITISLTACSEKQEWGYSEENGPDNWAEISDEYALCGEGTSQSPIDIDTKNASSSEDSLTINYSDTDFNIVDTGHSVEFEVEGTQPSITYNDNNYVLDQIHFHNESENTLNGKHYPLEGHFVHHLEGQEDNKLVISIMFDLGDENEIIADSFNNIGSSVNFNPQELLPESHNYYEFIGSLTTPPCSEDVKWIIFNDNLTIDENQLNAFKEHYSNNNRPTQALNERSINHVNN